MNKYLIEILKIQSSVILPGLGALMVPSSKSGKIVFNPHLKFNDGSLARFIAEKEGVDEQEAQNRVAKFVREIEAELGKGNTYDMFEFGKFFENKDGETDFEMFGAATKKTVPPTTTPPVVKEKVDKPTTKPKVEKPKVEKPKVAKTDPPKAAKTEKKKETPKKETQKPKETEDSKSGKNVFVPSAEKAVEKAKDSVKDAADKVTKAVTEKKDKAVDKVKEEKDKVVEKAPVIPVPPTKADPTPKAPVEETSKNTYTPSKEEEKESKKPVAVAAAAGAAAAKTTAATTKKTTETTKTTVKKVEEGKKKRSKLPWIILLLLLIGLGVAGYFFKDKIMDFFNGEENKTEQTTSDEDANNGEGDTDPETVDGSTMVADADSTDMADTTDQAGAMDAGTEVENATDEENQGTEDTTEPEVVETPVTTPNTSSNGNYHVIGNSFSEKGNAERYVQDMNGKGYSASILGRFDGLYLVSLGSYDTRDAANSGRKGASSDAGSAWIFKYPK